MNERSEIRPHEGDPALRDLADRVRRLGLETPAVFLLEMQKPLARFAGHGIEMILPMMPAPWRERARKYGALVADPARLEALIQRLEQGQAP